MPRDIWIIEARDAQGSLSFVAPQPESVFGLSAITGLTEDDMAKRVFARLPDACLTGDAIALWPSLIDPRWKARRKTW